ncbi:MAG: hypothetical protein IH621_05075 [Krumholzibacteria bacterium]|nr:hypothetical protein [Candidatus Krumholzibacteria bacterium]
MRLRLLPPLLAGLAGLAAPAGAAAEPCGRLELEVYGTVPSLFYGDLPDSLAGLLLRWTDACGPAEVIGRTRILASIWDDAFDEWVYEDTIIDDLAAYGRLLAKGRDPAADDPRERYDLFTVSLADQLLPHTDRGSLEEFFCLFYSGRTGEAWTLLGSPELADTELARRYGNEREILQKPQPVVTVALGGGAWLPGGDLDFAGDKTLVGALVGARGHMWLGRIVLEMRVGRTARPYTVDEQGLPRLSDRFDAVLLGIELGRIITVSDRFAVDLFGGVGADAVKPFKDEDLTLGTVQGSLGLGCRVFAGPNRSWMFGLDGRREWLADRNTSGTPLGGQAWSLRLVCGIVLDQGRGARARALSP